MDTRLKCVSVTGHKISSSAIPRVFRAIRVFREYRLRRLGTSLAASILVRSWQDTGS